MRKIILLIVISIITIFANAQEFKAGNINIANDKKPVVKISYNRTYNCLTFKILDAGDNCGLKNCTFKGKLLEQSFDLNNSVDTTLYVYDIENSPIHYSVTDIGGNEKKGSYYFIIKKESTPYSVWSIVPEYTYASSNKNLWNEENFSLYVGKSTETYDIDQYVELSPLDNDYLYNGDPILFESKYKYKCIFLSYDKYNYYIDYLKHGNVKVGYMFGTSYMFCGYEFMPYARFDGINLKTAGVGIQASLYCNIFAFGGIENKTSYEIRKMHSYFSNEIMAHIPLGFLFGITRMSLGYEYAIFNGQHFSDCKLTLKIRIPYNGVRPEEHALMQFFQ